MWVLPAVLPSYNLPPPGTILYRVEATVEASPDTKFSTTTVQCTVGRSHTADETFALIYFASLLLRFSLFAFRFCIALRALRPCLAPCLLRAVSWIVVKPVKAYFFVEVKTSCLACSS